jgi:hypothetical protein
MDMTTKVRDLEWICVNLTTNVWAAYSSDKLRMYMVAPEQLYESSYWTVTWAWTKNKKDTQREIYKFSNRWEAQNYAEILEATHELDESKVDPLMNDRHFAYGREWKNLGVVNNTKVFVSVSDDEKSAFVVVHSFNRKNNKWYLSRREWEKTTIKVKPFELKITPIGEFNTLDQAQQSVASLTT